MAAPTAPPDPPECVAKYAQYLKDKYKRMPILPDGDWPPSLGRQYTRLAMIEQKRELPGAEYIATMERDYIHGNIDNIVKRKKAIQLPEVFLRTEDGVQQLKILMDGAPGVGKSTLSRKICKDWASGELLQQYHLVILLPLRQANIRQARSIEELIYIDDPDLKQQVVQHIKKTSGEQIMLIVDGYDELSYEDRTQHSFFLDIVQEYQFSYCSVLVTSRPYASGDLQQLQSINRHVEVLGFTEEQIKHCIMENLPDKAKAIELVQTLKERQDIASLCYIPLNCAIVLYVYEKEKCTLPHSLTKLYETFILNAVKRHTKIIGNDPSIIRRFHTLESLPETLQHQLSTLSKLAYGGLVADKMVFSMDNLEAVFPDCMQCSDLDVELLGLISVFRGFTSTGEELSYQFLHLTIQEFLAARWAVHQLSDCELLKFFQDHLQKERYRMVLLFLAGISQMNFLTAKLLFQGCKYPIRRFDNVKYFLYLAHLIYESRNFSLFNNLAKTLKRAVLSVAWYSMLPFDCLVLAHFLAWCDYSLKLLNLSGCSLTSQFIEIMHKVNLKHHGTTRIEEVDVSNNSLMIKLSLLSKIPMFECTRKLKASRLHFIEGASSEQVDLLCLLNMRHLTTLTISVKYNNSKVVYFLSLNRFQFKNGKVDSQNAVNIFRSLEHNTCLEELDLSGNTELAEGDSEAVGCGIEKMLNVNTKLKLLNLYGCRLTNEIAHYFANGLARNHSVRKVILHSNNIGSTGAVSIFRSLEHNTSLEELDLSRNTELAEDDSEAVGFAIQRMLNTNSTLKSLNLSGCNVTNIIAEHIRVGLTKNISLETLDLQSSKLSSSCAVSLLYQVASHPALSIVGDMIVLGVGKVKLNRGTIVCVIGGMVVESLMELFRALNSSGMKSWLNVQNITDQIVEHYAVGLAESPSVQSLDLKNSNISSTGTVTIFRSLEHNTSLEELDLSWNSQLAEGDSEAVGFAIERMLKVNKTLKVLNLHDCEITDPIAEHITTGMTNNMSLETLNVRSSCKLSGRCAVFLLKQTTTCLALSRLHIGEVNVLGVGKVEMDEGYKTIVCELGDTIAENCVEFFRALNDSGIPVSKLTVHGLTDQTTEHFAVGLTESQSIQSLDLLVNSISSAGAVSIFRSLEYNTSLEELDLYESWQHRENDSEAVGCAIESMLKVNRTLKVLNVGSCKVTDPIAKHITNGLTRNTSLVTLNMESCKLSVKCAVSLLQQVTSHPTVTRVHIGEVNVLGVGRVKMYRGTVVCFIGAMIPENCVEFFKALNHSGMKHSRMNVQDLTDQTTEHFAVGLAESNSVLALCLKHCNISSAGAVSIFRSLEHNTSLEELDLSGNSQLPEGDSEVVGCTIERMLCTNRTLKVLNLSGCGITDPIVKHILTGLTKNTSLVTLGMASSKLRGSFAVSLFQQKTTHPTLSITVGEVNVLGVGRVKMDRGTIHCVIGETIAENCVEFFRALNKSGMKVSKLTANTRSTIAEYLAVGFDEGLLVQMLHFRANSINSTGAVSIFRSLEHNSSLEELDLSGNSQLAEGDSEAVGCAIERMLNVNRTLKVLNLSDCNATDPIVKHILAGLTKNTSLLSLDMGLCTLSGRCAVSLLQQTATSPSLSRVHVGEVNVLGVGRVGMDKGIIWCVIGDIFPNRWVEFFRALNDSDMKVSKLTANAIYNIAEYLALGFGEGLSVQMLYFKRANSINSAGAVSIFKSLEYNTSLKELDLSEGWQISKDESEAVGCAIEGMLNVNRTLEVLDLSGCNVTDPITKHILSGLTKNVSLTTLNLGLCTVSGSCAVPLLQVATTHPTLSIVVGEVNVLGVGKVKLDRGTMWCIVGDTIPDNCNEFFRALNNSGMKVSRLIVECLEDQTTKHFAVGLAESQSVQTLKLEHCNISSAGAVSIFRSLEHNTSLEELDLSWSSQLAEGNSEAVGCAIERMLNVNRTLKVLNMFNCKLDTIVVTHITAGLAHNASLAELNIGGNILSVTSECWIHLFKALCNNTSLKKLDIGDNQLGVKGSLVLAEMLSCNKSLTELNLGWCNFFDVKFTMLIASGMHHNTSLKKLDISRNKLGMEGSVALAEILSCNKSLTELHLSVSEAELREIARELLHNASLKKLDISCNKLGMEGSVALAEMLSSNKSLTELNLGWCHLPEAGLREIARGLLQNTSLKKLDISCNKPGMEGSVALAEMLSCNKSLTELNLGLCHLPEAGLREIARGLLQNTSLKKLDISHNNLRMEGSVAVAEMLSCNKSLTELNLEWCVIPVAGLRKIARGLLQNTSLKKLDISHNNSLGMEGSVALAEMLSCNKSLTELNLWLFHIPDAGLREIARELLQNTSLQTLTLWPPERKRILEAEIKRLKRSGCFTPQSLSRLEIKLGSAY